MSSANDAYFSCRIESAKVISDLLNCLGHDFHKDQDCEVTASSETVIFEVKGRGKSFQTRLTLSAELFDEFVCSAPDELHFSVKFLTLHDCLRLFGTANETTMAIISFSCEDAILKLSLEESGALTICDINTIYVDEPLENLFTVFRSSAEECQLLIKSEALKESLSELSDSQWSDIVTVKVDAEKQEMNISTIHPGGSLDLLLPRTSESFLSFRCSATCTTKFLLKSFLAVMKPLSVATESYLCINREGMMCIQHKVDHMKEQESFFDCVITPIYEGDDDN